MSSCVLCDVPKPLTVTFLLHDNVWLHDKPFDVMTCFWCHEELFVIMTYFWHHNQLFDVMANFLTSWHACDIMTKLLTTWRLFDVTTNFLTSWNVLTSWKICNIFFTFWQTFWHHDIFLTSWRTFLSNEEPLYGMTNLMTSLIVCFYAMTNVLLSWRIFNVMTSFLSAWYICFSLLKDQNIMKTCFWYNNKLLDGMICFSCHNELL